MHFFKSLITTLLLIFIHYHLEAFNSVASSRSETFQVGDTVADYALINLINHQSGTAKISDFKGKLLILDFWSTGCGSCIESWPKLEKLQQEFKGRIQIVLVNPWQDKSTILPVIKKRRDAGIVNLTLPVVCKDTVAKRMFGVDTVPHLVWIDENSVIQNITYGDVLNSYNINAVLARKSVHFRQKTDLKLSMDISKPLFVNGNGGRGNAILNYSVISSYETGMTSTRQLTANEHEGYGIYVAQPIDVIIRYAFGADIDPDGLNIMPVASSRTIFEVANPAQYSGLINNEIQWKNWYVYQLISRKRRSVIELQEIMQTEICQYFGIQAKWEKRKLRCLVLNASDTSRIKFTGGGYSLDISDVEAKFNSVTISDIVKGLESTSGYFFSPYPIIDETGYKGLVGNINLVANVFDPVKFDAAIRKYGLSLTLQERLVDVLVITETKNQGY